MQDQGNLANLIANTKTLVCLLILATFANASEGVEQNSGVGGDRPIGTHVGGHGRNPWRAEATTAFFDDFDRPNSPVVGNGWTEPHSGNRYLANEQTQKVTEAA